MGDKTRTGSLHKITLQARQRVVAKIAEMEVDELTAVLDKGGLDPNTADKLVENVLGIYALPFGVALGVRVNAKDYVVPMVVEEPSVIAAASKAAKMVRAGGGFSAEVDPPLMTCQVQVFDVPDVERAVGQIEKEKDAILLIANNAVPGLVNRGGGARSLEVRLLASDMLVVHIYVDCRDAMGANLVNTVAEATGSRIAALAGGTQGLRILSNLCDKRRVRVCARVPLEALATRTHDGAAVADGIANASRFAVLDPYRAATHNKGIMNGIDSVCMATGNDWRAVEAGAHAYASRSGRYAPLATWRRDGTHFLEGKLDLPMALGTVGGTLRVHPVARLALRLLTVTGALELAAVAASVGLATNLAALCALATEGIQWGHMALHARSVAVAAGAEGDEVEIVAGVLAKQRDISVAAASSALQVHRSSPQVNIAPGSFVY